MRGLVRAVKALFCLMVMGLGAAAGVAAAQGITPEAQVASMRRGVNVLGYDPLWRDPGQARFQAKHFKVIKDGGFDTVRINLHAFAFMDQQNRLSAGYLKTLDRLVKDALDAGLTVILDEHNFNECAKDIPACRPKLMAFWGQIGEVYKDAPDRVVFEILNEPNSALNDVWNDILSENLAVIRKSNPVRNVVIGPRRWNSLDELPNLKLPEADRHIIVTVHYYTPMEFTHQGASWVPEMKALGVPWGTKGERDRLEADFDKVQAWAKAHNRPILLGEFGAYDKGPMPSRVAYTSAAARAAEARGWAWAYWQFDSDFIVYDIPAGQWVEPIHGALIPEQAKPENAERSEGIAQYIINAPAVTSWFVYGSGQTNALRTDEAVQGKKALHVEVKGPQANSWDVGAVAPIAGKIAKGDEIVLAFWARIDTKDANASLELPAMIQEASAPYTKVVFDTVALTGQWQVKKIKGISPADFASGQVNVGLHLGKATVPVELGPVFVLNMGPPE